MLKIFGENRQKYYDEIVKNLDHYEYRDERYSLNFSIAIGYSIDKIDLTGFINPKRKTDKLVVLENNLCCMILDGTNYDTAVKAASNLQTEFQVQHFNKRLYAAVVTYEDYNNEMAMVNFLFDLLEYSISENISNIVLDKTQMNNE